jgi:excisionase family DNA binding protein
VAARLGVSLRTVQKWVAAGHLGVVDLSAHTRRVPPEELARFVAAHYRPPTTLDC